MNRWRRYQLARLDGLINGLLIEARRLPADDLEVEIVRLGSTMRCRLNEHCDAVRANVHERISLGEPANIPDLAFERL